MELLNQRVCFFVTLIHIAKFPSTGIYTTYVSNIVLILRDITLLADAVTVSQIHPNASGVLCSSLLPCPQPFPNRGSSSLCKEHPFEFPSWVSAGGELSVLFVCKAFICPPAWHSSRWITFFPSCLKSLPSPPLPLPRTLPPPSPQLPVLLLQSQASVWL